MTGERGTLMGAIQGLLLAQYETLRENGHEPSEAFNETVEELTQSLMPLFAENGMDWMYANCSTTAQRGALDWMGPFHDAVKPVFEKLYREVACGNEAQRSIDTNSKPDYREGLEKNWRHCAKAKCGVQVQSFVNCARKTIKTPVWLTANINHNELLSFVKGMLVAGGSDRCPFAFVTYKYYLIIS